MIDTGIPENIVTNIQCVLNWLDNGLESKLYIIVPNTLDLIFPVFKRKEDGKIVKYSITITKHL